MDEQRRKKLRETSTSERHTNYKTYFKPFREQFKNEKLVNISVAKARSYFSKRQKLEPNNMERAQKPPHFLLEQASSP